jgi:preprotein translocase subunit SecF
LQQHFVKNDLTMLRLMTLTFVFAYLQIGIAQTEKNVESAEKLARLQQKTEQINNRIVSMEASLSQLKAEMKANETAVKAEIQRAQELQAQNERAMNVALDGFTEKFEKQNETVKGVQAELGQKFNNQMLMMALGFVALVLIFLLLIRSATQKALKQNVSNWNTFQEHLLKK